MADDQSNELVGLFEALAEVLARQLEANATMIEIITKLTDSDPPLRPLVSQLAGDLRRTTEQMVVQTEMIAAAVRSQGLH